MLINATRLNIKSKYKEYLLTVSSSVFNAHDENQNEFVNCWVSIAQRPWIIQGLCYCLSAFDLGKFVNLTFLSACAAKLSLDFWD